jgi:hypothetical protein
VLPVVVKGVSSFASSQQQQQGGGEQRAIDTQPGAPPAALQKQVCVRGRES